jgi:hypothetical protein
VLWDKLIDIHAVVHEEVVKPVRPVTDTSLAFGNFILERATIDPVTKVAPTKTPTLSWNTVPGAAQYEVWLARVAPAQSRLFVSSSLVNTTEFTPPADLDTAIYRFWVRPLAANGASGAWSLAQTFEVQTTLLAPLNPTFDVRPTFTWEAIPFATAYQIFVRTRTGDIVEAGITETSWTPSQDLPSGPIRWWVRATDSIGNRGWGNPGVTRVDGLSQVIAPTGTVNTIIPTFTWQSVAGAGRYILHVQNVDTGAVVIRQDRLIGTSFTPSSALATGNYRVWVKAIDGSTDLFTTGLWSRPAEFIIAQVIDRQAESPSLITLESLLAEDADEAREREPMELAQRKSSSDQPAVVDRGAEPTTGGVSILEQSLPMSIAIDESEVSLLDAILAEPLLLTVIGV